MVRFFIKALFSYVVVVTAAIGCGKIGDSETTLSKVKFEDWPLTDCSTSTSPVRDLVAYKLLGVPYNWEVDMIGGSTYRILPNFQDSNVPFTYNDYNDKNLCSGTHGAYTNLIEGKTDIIIASRDISKNEMAEADSLRVELETAPLATDALVFIVNPKNPVKNLTADQVRKIYTGEITNWKEVGGIDHTITPYIRDADSGSQEKMETLVMAGLTMIEGLPETIGSVMLSPYYSIEEDEYGIGYTPYFYCTAMVRDLIKVNVLSINGVVPTKETLKANKYPFVSSIYAAVRKSESHDSRAYTLYQFLFTKNGAEMIDESGYIPFLR